MHDDIITDLALVSYNMAISDLIDIHPPSLEYEYYYTAKVARCIAFHTTKLP